MLYFLFCYIYCKYIVFNMLLTHLARFTCSCVKYHHFACVTCMLMCIAVYCMKCLPHYSRAYLHCHNCTMNWTQGNEHKWICYSSTQCLRGLLPPPVQNDFLYSKQNITTVFNRTLTGHTYSSLSWSNVSRLLKQMKNWKMFFLCEINLGLCWSLMVCWWSGETQDRSFTVVKHSGTFDLGLLKNNQSQVITIFYLPYRPEILLFFWN